MTASASTETKVLAAPSPSMFRNSPFLPALPPVEHRTSTCFFSTPETSAPFYTRLSAQALSESNAQFALRYSAYSLDGIQNRMSFKDAEGARIPPPGDDGIIKLAKKQFATRGKAFGEKAASGESRTKRGPPPAFASRRKGLDLAPLKLDLEDFGSENSTATRLAPTTFDVIDTSNLTDHIGLLSILVATAPLLKPELHAVLETDPLISAAKDDTLRSTFEKHTCMDLSLLSALTGLAPSIALFAWCPRSSMPEDFLNGAASSSESSVRQRAVALSANETLSRWNLSAPRDVAFSPVWPGTLAAIGARVVHCSDAAHATMTLAPLSLTFGDSGSQSRLVTIDAIIDVAPDESVYSLYRDRQQKTPRVRAHIPFPIPVDGTRSRLRIARKSGFVEVSVPPLRQDATKGASVSVPRRPWRARRIERAVRDSRAADADTLALLDVKDVIYSIISNTLPSHRGHLLPKVFGLALGDEIVILLVVLAIRRQHSSCGGHSRRGSRERFHRAAIGPLFSWDPLGETVFEGETWLDDPGVGGATTGAGGKKPAGTTAKAAAATGTTTAKPAAVQATSSRTTSATAAGSRGVDGTFCAACGSKENLKACSRCKQLSHPFDASSARHEPRLGHRGGLCAHRYKVPRRSYPERLSKLQFSLCGSPLANGGKNYLLAKYCHVRTLQLFEVEGAGDWPRVRQLGAPRHPHTPPAEEDAMPELHCPTPNIDLLLLGAGNVRSVLYTVACSSALKQTKMLDFTLVDHESAVLARNIFILHFFIKYREELARLENAWDVYYHMYLNKSTMALAREICLELLDASPDTFRAVSSRTYASIRRLWQRYADACRPKPLSLEELKAEVKSENAKVVLSSTRSVAQLLALTSTLFAEYWSKGVLDKTQPGPFLIRLSLSLSPTIVSRFTMANARSLASTMPPRSPHIRMRKENAIRRWALPASPLLPRNSTSMWSGAWTGARERWAQVDETSRSSLPQPDTERFLRRTARGPPSAFASRTRGFELSPHILDLEDYGSEKSAPSRPAPTAFDVIDTSNLTDYLGLLNIQPPGSVRETCVYGSVTPFGSRRPCPVNGPLRLVPEVLPARRWFARRVFWQPELADSETNVALSWRYPAILDHEVESAISKWPSGRESLIVDDERVRTGILANLRIDDQMKTARMVNNSTGPLNSANLKSRDGQLLGSMRNTALAILGEENSRRFITFMNRYQELLLWAHLLSVPRFAFEMNPIDSSASFSSSLGVPSTTFSGEAAIISAPRP
ncbi:hypothetical protein BDK51DRAFT_43005 [Blyttiomyces helicus]|uniref:DUF4470 domain-containing protein n=1 Tax=Blyttiomyces helicus TaxID=388810 RepID=A0A4P9WS87_9FUNG|nr:hypothetical protein BDK51DRAFT_43005 [Blyttiomyces helicus]|eukprot:RKO94160.1 hypothetical protein BDK51DRAFT_43005 [Blyttiomyces helicus]